MINDILKKINKGHEVESSKVELAKHHIALALADELKLNVKREGFDVVYDNCLLNNHLFSTIENEHIKNEFACMRAMIIVEFVKNNM